MSQVTCYLNGCSKRVLPNSVYCSLLHMSDAVKRGEAEACVYCHQFAKYPGYPTCTKTCGTLLAAEKRMTGVVAPRQAVRSKTPALLSPTPTIPQPAVKAKKAPENVPQNDIAYPCGCVIRILKMSSRASAPGTCPVCPPPIRKESSTQTDSNDEPKPTAAHPTDTGSAVTTDSPQQTSFKPTTLSYTCGCVVRGVNPPWKCPICGTGVADLGSVTGPPSGSRVPQGQEQQFPMNLGTTVVDDDNARTRFVYDG